MRVAILGLMLSICSLRSVSANTLQFVAATDTGETVSFALDTSIPNSYSPILYPNHPVSGVYLNAVHNLNFEGTEIAVSDLTTDLGESALHPATLMQVGPLFNGDSLSLFLIFLNPTLVDPLSSNTNAYEQSFLPFQSVLFSPVPPPRTHTDPLLTLTVTAVPEPSFVIPLAVTMLWTIILKKSEVLDV